MTRDQKTHLRTMLRERPALSNAYIADVVGCAVTTVRKYRRYEKTRTSKC